MVLTLIGSKRCCSMKDTAARCALATATASAWSSGNRDSSVVGRADRPDDLTVPAYRGVRSRGRCHRV